MFKIDPHLKEEIRQPRTLLILGLALGLSLIIGNRFLSGLFYTLFPAPLDQTYSSPIALEKAAIAKILEVYNNKGLDPKEVRVVSIQKTIWPDASLGAPEGDKFYAQAQTPGYLLGVEVDKQGLEIHTDNDLKKVIILKDGVRFN